MDVAGHALYYAATLALRDDTTTTSVTATATSSAATSTSTSSTASPSRPASYKIVGICLAVASGLFIGCSFVLKKVGLLKANVKYNEEAGEGYGYLKNAYWWLGMTLMIIGEICNFVAYAFTDAILVTPLGALSVVLTTILSWVFLKERLSFVGWVACFLCIVGSVVITLNAPAEAAVADIQQMQHYVIAPGFLSYAGVIIVACLIIVFYVGPRYGKKTMMVYLSVCSLIGGLSVVATQGLGAAIVAQINGKAQFNQWFLYVLFVFVVATLLTEIIYLNKALNLFNAALVTPTYYVFFTSSTIVASAVLFQGFHGTTTQIVDVVLGFLTICSGVILLQLAKSAKDVPDAKVFSGDLDQIRTVAEVEEPEYEPRADTIRGGAGIVRAISKVRTKRQANEAIRIHEERMKPISENGEFEWDGLRRRKTVSSRGEGSISRKERPPLGMAQFPDDVSEPDSEVHPGFFGRIGRKSLRSHGSQQKKRRDASPLSLHSVGTSAGPLGSDAGEQAYDPVPDKSGVLEDVYEEDTAYKGAGHVHFAGDALDRRDRATSNTSTLSPYDRRDRAASNVSSLAPPQPPPHGGSPSSGQRRQFSFQSVFHRTQHSTDSAATATADHRPVSRGGLSFVSGGHRNSNPREYPAGRATTEEERMGLVHGDSQKTLPLTGDEEASTPSEERSIDSGDEWQITTTPGLHRTASPDQLDLADAAPSSRVRTLGRDRFDDDDDDDDDDGAHRTPRGARSAFV